MLFDEGDLDNCVVFYEYQEWLNVAHCEYGEVSSMQQFERNSKDQYVNSENSLCLTATSVRLCLCVCNCLCSDRDWHSAICCRTSIQYNNNRSVFATSPETELTYLCMLTLTTGFMCSTLFV